MAPRGVRPLVALWFVALLAHLQVIHASAVLSYSSATLSQARSQMTATSATTASGESIAFFAGGSTTSEYTAIVDTYNRETGKWSTLSPGLSLARSSLAAASIGDVVFFAGGYNLDFYNGTDVVDIYNVTSRTWTIATLSEPRFALAATSVEDIVIFAGGLNDITDLNVVDIYNVTSKQWTVATLSLARGYLTAISVGSLAIFAGGAADVSVNTVDIYDAATAQWSTATLSLARENLASATVGNLVIFAGGDNGNSTAFNSYNAVDIYDSSSKTWKIATLSQPRTYLAGASLTSLGLALFAGGENDQSESQTSEVSAVIDIYNASSNSWTTGSLPVALSLLQGTSVGGDTALFGGGILQPGGYFFASYNASSEVGVVTASAASSVAPFWLNYFYY